MEATMVDITFLGTGSAFSAGRRSNVALLIETASLRMLVEAGPTVVQQLARAKVEAREIDHLFVSHAHGDHSLGFPIFALNRLPSPPPLYVYAGAGTAAVLKGLLALAFHGFDDERVNLHWRKLSEQGPDATALVEGVTLRTAVVPHPANVPTLAARWDLADGPSVAFVTDTTPCAATVELAHGCDLLIHESGFSAVLQPDVDMSEYFHSTAQQAGEVARQAGCPRLALVHLGPEIGEHPDVLAAEARADTDLEVVVPEDGGRICLENS
jgi:ribonuclease Z